MPTNLRRIDVLKSLRSTRQRFLAEDFIDQSYEHSFDGTKIIAFSVIFHVNVFPFSTNANSFS